LTKWSIGLRGFEFGGFCRIVVCGDSLDETVALMKPFEEL
jgi:hypothetical protein